MAGTDPKPKPDDRAERLAAALRANLRRRKDQARSRQDDGAPVADGADGED